MTDGTGSNRAIAYVRVSTVRQVQEGNSLASQTEAIRFYARSKGIRIRSKDIVIDDGTSAGIPIWERKGGKLLLKKCESGDFGHLIITKMDRMFRITSDAIHTIDELNDMDIGFHVIDMGGQSLDTTSAMGRFILRFVASSAELERGMTSERTREAMQYLRKNGMRFTRSIYGWRVTKGRKLRPNWKEQDRLDYMYWQVNKMGTSAFSVARSMNKIGALGKEGGKWTATSVKRVIENRYHRERERYKKPSWWGNKPWHRRVPIESQRDEKIVVKPVTEV